jgi:hypothetical protein
MKRLALVLVTFIFSASALATDGWLSVGAAPKSEGGGTSAALGFKGASNFGVQFGFIGNSDFNDSSLLDYPVPHSSFTNLGVKRTKNTFGLDVLYFFPAGESLRPFIGVGGYSGERKDIAQSNVTGWLYTQSDKSKFNLTGEAGIQYKFSGGFILGVGYHSLRGPNLSLGMGF